MDRSYYSGDFSLIDGGTLQRVDWAVAGPHRASVLLREQHLLRADCWDRALAHCVDLKNCSPYMIAGIPYKMILRH